MSTSLIPFSSKGFCFLLGRGVSELSLKALPMFPTPPRLKPGALSSPLQSTAQHLQTGLCHPHHTHSHLCTIPPPLPSL